MKDQPSAVSCQPSAKPALTAEYAESAEARQLSALDQARRVLVWWVVIGIVLPFWVGAFSGGYAHRVFPSIFDPDNFIHGGIFLITPFLMAMGLAHWRESRRKKREKDSAITAPSAVNPAVKKC